MAHEELPVVHKTVCYFNGEHWVVEMTEETPAEGEGEYAFWGQAEFVRFDFNLWRQPVGGGWNDIEDVKVVRRLEAIMQATSDLNALAWNAGEGR